jgi:hypothetical protein
MSPKTTARKGNPLSASRGAAVRRAKRALGEAIDARLDLDVERMELALLASLIGTAMESVRARLDAATLGEVLAWTEALEGGGTSCPVPVDEALLFKGDAA